MVDRSVVVGDYRTWFLRAILGLVPFACQEGESNTRGPVDRDGEEGGEEEGPELELVYESRTLVHADGTRELISEAGEVGEGIAERVARPWTFSEEEYLYSEHAWEIALDDGAVEQGYQIHPSDK